MAHLDRGIIDLGGGRLPSVTPSILCVWQSKWLCHESDLGFSLSPEVQIAYIDVEVVVVVRLNHHQVSTIVQYLCLVISVNPAVNRIDADPADYFHYQVAQSASGGSAECIRGRNHPVDDTRCVCNSERWEPGVQGYCRKRLNTPLSYQSASIIRTLMLHQIINRRRLSK
jgi:hypothetical protein